MRSASSPRVNQETGRRGGARAVRGHSDHDPNGAIAGEAGHATGASAARTTACAGTAEAGGPAAHAGQSGAGRVCAACRWDVVPEAVQRAETRETTAGGCGPWLCTSGGRSSDTTTAPTGTCIARPTKLRHSPICRDGNPVPGGGQARGPRLGTARFEDGAPRASEPRTRARLGAPMVRVPEPAAPQPRTRFAAHRPCRPVGVSVARAKGRLDFLGQRRAGGRGVRADVAHLSRPRARPTR